MILACNCSNTAQDELYGRGMRLFNERTNNKPPRCTVCGRDAKGSSGAVKGNSAPAKKKKG